MTQEKQALLVLKGMLSEATPEEREPIDRAMKALKDTLAGFDPEIGITAITIVSLELLTADQAE